MTDHDETDTDRAIQTARRRIARGERPLFSVRPLGDGMTARVATLDLNVEVGPLVSTIAAVRQAIATLLDVPTSSFDIAVEAGR